MKEYIVTLEETESSNRYYVFVRIEDELGAANKALELINHRYCLSERNYRVYEVFDISKIDLAYITAN